MVLRLNDGGKGNTGSAAPVVHPPAPVAAQKPVSSGGGGGGGGGSYGGGGGGVSYATPLTPTQNVAPIAPVPVIDPNAYKSDASYIAQMAALAASKQNYETDYTNKVNQYGISYAEALKNLGFSPAAAGAIDNPATPNIDESKGQWLTNDLNTAAGRGYNSQKNDFGARGLLQSSLYATAVDNLMRSLNDQNTSLGNAKQAYLSGLATDKAQFEAQNTYQGEQAKQDAMARVLAGLLQG